MLKKFKLSLEYYVHLKTHYGQKIGVDEKPWLAYVDATTNVINI
jgi:hypothetical protein